MHDTMIPNEISVKAESPSQAELYDSSAFAPTRRVAKKIKTMLEMQALRAS